MNNGKLSFNCINGLVALKFASSRYFFFKICLIINYFLYFCKVLIYK